MAPINANNYSFGSQTVYASPPDRKTMVPFDKDVLTKLGISGEDFKFLLSQIDSDASDGIYKQLRDLTLTLKMEYSDQLAEKKQREDAEYNSKQREYEQAKKALAENQKDLSDTQRNWNRSCWQLLSQVDNGERIKIDWDDQVHIRLVESKLLTISIFTKKLKLRKPLDQIAVTDFPPCSLMDEQRKRIQYITDWVQTCEVRLQFKSKSSG